MPAAALALALMSAVASAVWNLLVKQAADTQAATAVALLLGVLLFAPSLAFGQIPAAAWPFIIASAVLQLAYFTLLATAYRRAELSLVFPLARGLAPVLVLVIGLVALGVRASTGELAGVLMVAVGAVAVRGLRVTGGLADTGLALLIAVCIASYTLVDSRGVRLASPAAYLEVVMALLTVPYLVLVARARSLRALRRELRPRAAVIGVGVIGGYDLALYGLRLAAAAPVAAVRESSVVIGTALAALVLRERVGLARFGGACLVAAGVAVLALAARS
ncbi:MAG TPA: EamA family transporter [Streptosporangiaceae bacterium]|nr:EamA family transporter [Streptosporangiaceae bacterium]